jgi:hypothetical protein
MVPTSTNQNDGTDLQWNFDPRMRPTFSFSSFMAPPSQQDELTATVYGAIEKLTPVKKASFLLNTALIMIEDGRQVQHKAHMLSLHFKQYLQVRRGGRKLSGSLLEDAWSTKGGRRASLVSPRKRSKTKWRKVACQSAPRQVLNLLLFLK